MQPVLLFRGPLHISPIKNNNQSKIVNLLFLQTRLQSLVPIFIYLFFNEKIYQKNEWNV